MEYPFGKALKRRVGCETPPERAARETGAVSGPGAKHLKTVSERPLIGHGGPRYRQRKAAAGRGPDCNKGGTAFYGILWWIWDKNVPCNSDIAGGFFSSAFPCRIPVHREERR
jgi:hypothetical protein